MHGKPMIGNGDVHRLRQLDSTYSLVDAEPDADAICEAIRDLRVDVHAQPPIAAAATIMGQILAEGSRKDGSDRPWLNNSS